MHIGEETAAQVGEAPEWLLLITLEVGMLEPVLHWCRLSADGSRTGTGFSSRGAAGMPSGRRGKARWACGHDQASHRLTAGDDDAAGAEAARLPAEVFLTLVQM